MKPSLLTFLCLLPFAGLALITWALLLRREQREKERVFKFWTAQCNQALAGLSHARNEEEYQQWSEVVRVNMRRYEKEVLGR